MTIQDIEQQLLDASVQGDLNTISTIILSLNESQAAQINPLVYDKVLGQLSLPYIGADPADTIRIVMEFASPYISSFTLGGVLANLAWNDNLGGLDAVIDNLTEVHLLPYPYGGLDDFTVSNVLDALVSNVQWHMNMGDDITAHNTAIRDFMEILGGHVTASAVGEALANLAWYDDLEGLDAIIDNLTAEHLLPEYQGGLSGFMVSNVLDALVSNVQWHMNMGDDITAHNTAIRDFMEILGGHVTASAIGEALSDLAWYDDLEGLDAIIDNLTAEHLLPEYQGGLSGFMVSNVLDALVANVQWHMNVGDDITAHNTAIRDFMEVLSGHVTSLTVSDAISNLAWNDNLEGLDAVIDNLTADHLLPQYQGGLDDFTISNALDALVANVQWHMNVGDDITAHNTAISDFMEVLSGHVVTEALDASLQSLSMASNFEGIDAIISNISTVQMDALSLTTEDMLADAGVRIMTDGNDYAYSTGESASIHGLGGNDTILGNTGDDHIFGGDGDDVLYDFRGGNNTLYGGEGNDVLYTGNGNDILYGSDGDDLIIGLGGADTFILREGDTGIDTIYYADAREGDRLDISDFLDQFDPLQDAIDDFVILSDDGFSTTVSVDVDGQGAGEAVQIATLYGSTGVEVEGIIDLSSITTV